MQYELYTRGEEATGVAFLKNGILEARTAPVAVYYAFNSGGKLASIKSIYAIGHNRYSTSGPSDTNHAQPLLGICGSTQFALSHNGNIRNASALRKDLKNSGIKFLTKDSDTEVIVRLIEQRGNIADGLKFAEQYLEGSYSLTILTKDGIYAVRDPHGIKPLCVGRRKDGVFIASESAAFNNCRGIEFDRDVERGEIFFVGRDGETRLSLGKKRKAFDIFEHVYFARPDSIIDGVPVGPYRVELGRKLALKDVQQNGRDFFSRENTIIVPIPNSGLHYSQGYQQGVYEATGIFIPIVNAFYRKRTPEAERSFTQPSHERRIDSISAKLSIIRKLVEGKIVFGVDDSTVRGNTDRKLAKIIRDAGAIEVHKRNGYAQTVQTCPYGIDMKTFGEHIANQYPNIKERSKELGFDSMLYNGILDLVPAGWKISDLCTRCVSNVDPLDKDAETRLTQIERRVSISSASGQ